MIRYWFGRPALYSVEISRIVLGLIYILIHFRYPIPNADYLFNNSDIGNYSPVGIMALFGKEMPSKQFIDILIVGSFFSALSLSIGFFSKTSLWLSLFFNLALRSLAESFYPNWSHGFNIIFLAHIAFLLAPIGRIWSVDRIIRLYIYPKKDVVLNELEGFWSVLLAQYAVALMFFNAFYWKIWGTPGKLTFEWAMGDNMRNQIVYRYPWVGDHIPEHLDWLVNTPWAYQALGIGNLLFQGGTILSVFFIKKPLWRFLLGLIFIIEELGLTLVMGLPDFQWFPLIVFFIDWDYLLGKIGLIKYTYENSFKNITEKYIPFKSTYIVLFLALYIFFSFGISKKYIGKSVFDLNVYPISEFAMFSVPIVTKEVPYVRVGSSFEVDTYKQFDLKDSLENRIKRNNYANYNYLDSNSVKSNLNTIFTKLNNNYFIANIDSNNIKEIRSYRTYYEFIPYPEKAGVRIKYKGLMGRLTKERDYYFAYAQILPSDKPEFERMLSISYSGYDESSVNLKLFYIYEFSAIEEPLQGEWINNTFYFNKVKTGNYNIILKIKDKKMLHYDIYIPMHVYI
jgi:hypothetical protein